MIATGYETAAARYCADLEALVAAALVEQREVRAGREPRHELTVAVARATDARAHYAHRRREAS